MNESHMMACARYVELNPVRAKLVRRARDWRSSSARAQLASRDDRLAKAAPLLRRVTDWPAFLGEGRVMEALELICTGKRAVPLGEVGP